MSPTLRACLWMIGSILSFTAMAIAGRAVSLDLDTFEIMLYRSVIGAGIVIVVAGYAGTLTQIRTRKPGAHLARNICHFTGQNLWFYAIATIPLAQVFALEFTSPLWVMVLAPLVLNERLTRSQLIAGAAGFIGILIVTRPGAQSVDAGLIAAALAAIGFAGSAVLTRRLTRTETITCILFYLTTMQAALGLICAGADGAIALPTLANLPFVAVIAVAGLVAHFCLTTALSLAPASIVMPIDFTRLPVIVIVGVLLYAEPLDPYVLLGAAVIFAANYYNIRASARA
ncbi:DMT family transporter [Marivita sp. GX14005]|uniref:DMT family transporter n=1 Tax=Marivita sp. GX14005 TaxID=2942276 RepID=UPI00201A132B|nr:DMT family transporter [Marivita sp. GX14005]MCL3883639.1 DMT family transporter [Marivita sp. GX14005]